MIFKGLNWLERCRDVEGRRLHGLLPVIDLKEISMKRVFGMLAVAAVVFSVASSAEARCCKPARCRQKCCKPACAAPVCNTCAPVAACGCK